MVLKCVWNNIEVAAFVGSVSFRKTLLTGMRYEVPAFAGMTTLLGGDGGDSSLRWNRLKSLLIPKIYKDKNE